MTMTRIALLLSIRSHSPYFLRDEQAQAGSTRQEPSTLAARAMCLAAVLTSLAGPFVLSLVL